MPLKDGSYKGANLATRRALLELLKLNGPLSSSAMAESFGVSPMAIRQHMQELEAAGDVVSESRPNGKGRPSKIWSLTAAADRHFPDRHRDLMSDLLESADAVLGAEALDKLLDERSSKQVAYYADRLADCPTVGDKLRRLAELRSEEGYMAEAGEDGEGILTLVENHCPICTAAKSCVGLCSRELQVFSAVLGPECRVERFEHLLAGGRRCAYRITVEGSE